MMSNIFVCQLNYEQQLLVEAKLRAALAALGYEGDELELIVEVGMDSRIIDLPLETETKKELIN